MLFLWLVRSLARSPISNWKPTSQQEEGAEKALVHDLFLFGLANSWAR